ncbi:hypothetical protein AMATHDRAFT_2909 [Amanita thiersii Skay4041]|uniref:AAA+ ATPase domain-containing protein n=1 Tax=Amanita thiersii Skay4041 TaxID=703135 RepID=A0A2A9NQN9_9AGAR|nr:hypothetical protein AMATHDRAFT_2909 [Amanita thiersii Skay4041]
MAPRLSQSSQKQDRGYKSKPKTVKLGTPLISTQVQKYDPLTAFSLSQSGGDELAHGGMQKSPKGKGKERDVGYLSVSSPDTDDRLWAELPVHVRKVEDVRRWFHEAFEGGPLGKLRRYRRILVLTGQAGTAKTTTVRVLGREMNFNILEWGNSGSDDNVNDTSYDSYESAFTKFETFFNRATNCRNLLPLVEMSGATSSQQSQKAQNANSRHIVLLEDLPNILHSSTQARFHATLRCLVDRPPSDPPVPVVIIISDSRPRGEAYDEHGVYSRGRNGDGEGVIDIRTVIPRDLLGGPYVTNIGFNPIAPTLLRRALQTLLSTHSSNKDGQPSKEVLDVVVESANGDIRNAIMALQFAYTIGSRDGKSRKRKKGGNIPTSMLESITRREQSLVLFHLLGKVLYNKRKGDPLSSSTSAKDAQREKMQELLMEDPPSLPFWLKEHERRASKVDVDMLYGNSPIDSSLLSLYIHQNYTQFVDGLDECDRIVECLSWVDSSGGEVWYQANPYRFHILSMGTLHALPSPVTRRNQKFIKPQFFEYLENEKEAWDSVHDTRNWLAHSANKSLDNSWRTCSWSGMEVALELGGVLKALERCHGTSRPPRTHQRFSRMEFQSEQLTSQQLTEDDVDIEEASSQMNDMYSGHARGNEEISGQWLESDEIEEF